MVLQRRGGVLCGFRLSHGLGDEVVLGGTLRFDEATRWWFSGFSRVFDDLRD
jgi:hypothetical protein